MLNVGELTEKKKTRVKVPISYSSGHVDFGHSKKRKSSHLLKIWKAVANASFDLAELKEELPAALERNVSEEFREYCLSDSVLKGCDTDQLSSLNNRLVLREIATFLSSLERAE